MTSWREQIDQDIVEPSAIRGLSNGQFPAPVLVDVHNGDGTRIGKLCAAAARSWTAMVAAARADGIVLDATDTYRPLKVQQDIFADRYRLTDQGSGKSRTCGGKRWYLRKGKATAACPGTSNHGLGLAVDNRFHGDGLHWLERNAKRFGWQWEVSDEDWHIHYMPGDVVPAAVLEVEAHHATSQEDDMPAPLYQLLVPNAGDDKGRVFLVGTLPGPDGRGTREYIDDNLPNHTELQQLEAQWGPHQPVNLVAWARIVRDTTLVKSL